MTSVCTFRNSNHLTPATHMAGRPAASGCHSNVSNGYHSNKLKKGQASFGSDVDKLPVSDYCAVNVRTAQQLGHAARISFGYQITVRNLQIADPVNIRVFVICFFRGMLLCFCAIQLQLGGRGETHRGPSEHLHREMLTRQC
jgi:hypothetical protein